MVSVYSDLSTSYRALPEGGWRSSRAGVHEASSAGPPKPRLHDRVREALRTRHYSRRTEEAYVAWIRHYIFFHGKRHPAALGGPEVTRFLSSLAAKDQVAASTLIPSQGRT